MSGNSLLTASVITKEALMELKNQLGFTKHVNCQYDDRFAVKGGKVGDTINIRKPARYEVSTGAVLNIQDSVDESVALQLDSQKHVGMAFSSKDLTLSIDEFKDRYIKPAVTALANSVDYTGYSAMYKSVFSSVGVPSATALPSTIKGFTGAKALMATLGAPQDDLIAIIDPLVEASLINGMTAFVNPAKAIGDQFEKGVMGRAAGSKFVSSANVAKHTIGTLGGTPKVKTTITAQGATSVVMDGNSSNGVAVYFKAGDIFSIAGVYALNPQTKQSTGQLMQFVVTADAAMTSGDVTPTFTPAIYTTGAKANCSKLPTDEDLVTIFGHASSYAGIICPQNMVFHRDAFVLGCADLELPNGVAMAARATDPESGLSIRLISDYDINNDRKITRLDVLFGWKCVYPELACRVVGQPA